MGGIFLIYSFGISTDRRPIAYHRIMSDFSLPSMAVDYLTANFAFTMELQCTFMAIQGAMKVRKGPNKKRSMAWFHAFCLSVVMGYGGGLFTPLLMGRPTGMLANDVNVATCIIAFVLVNCVPFDLGFKVLNTFPATIITTLFAELFRVMGVVNFCNLAFNSFKDNPSPYYPIPVIGPIAYATILGNMGSFFTIGFHGYLEKGMPWSFQKGLFCSSFYHFYANDSTGFIGTNLRHAVNTFAPFIKLGLDDKTFPIVFVSIFMHTMALLQLPYFLGASFSPFTVVYDIIDLYSMPKKSNKNNSVAQKTLSAVKTEKTAQQNGASEGTVKKKKKSKSKKIN
jgi:hypothetical protein